MPYKDDSKEDFSTLWSQYVSVLHQLVKVRQRRPPKTFLAAFNSFFSETFEELNKKSFVAELSSKWRGYESSYSGKPAARLLRKEINAFISGFEKVTGVSPSWEDAPPSKKHWRRKGVTAKEMIGVGKTILESILDLIGAFLPKWVRSLLKILKEILDIVA